MDLLQEGSSSSSVLKMIRKDGNVEFVAPLINCGSSPGVQTFLSFHLIIFFVQHLGTPVFVHALLLAHLDQVCTKQVGPRYHPVLLHDGKAKKACRAASM